MIAVPYHLGRRDVEAGSGPSKIAEALGRPCFWIETAFTDECNAMVDLNVRLAQAIAKHGCAPLVLAGSCNLCVGVLAGLNRESLGILWFDAHGDFNTPETSLSGRLDGMALAIATGHCHAELRERAGLRQPVPEEKVLLVETRDLDPDEGALLERSSISMIKLDDLSDAIDHLATIVDGIYLHIDIDVLDPAESPGANCSMPGGLAPQQLYDALALVVSKIPIAAGTIANYNPDRDREDRTLRIAANVAGILNTLQ